MSNAPPVSASVVRTHVAPKARKLHDVPFVELFGGRLQGVVSSGSDADRVYCAFIEADTLNFTCGTNNNRPCGGLRGSPCKHLAGLLAEAGLQFGVERVARYLRIPGDVPAATAPRDLMRWIHGAAVRADAGTVFSRFLGYLRYLELRGSSGPLPEMPWITAGSGGGSRGREPAALSRHERLLGLAGNRRSRFITFALQGKAERSFMAESLQALREVPEGVAHAAGLITGLDSAFAVGFGRLGAERVRALEAVNRAFTGTPLARPLAAGVAAMRRSEFAEKHFVALAAARAALQGAQHDALAAQAAAALGRSPDRAPPAEAEAPQAIASHHAVWLESARQWLVEIALAGFLQLGSEAILPFSGTLEKIQGEPALLRHAALLTGFFNELAASTPAGSMPDVPVFRWTDLWSRAMVLAAKPPSPLREDEATGELAVLGVDIRQHTNLASVVAYGLLKTSADEAPAIVRTTISAYKVDVLTGTEMWGLFRGQAAQLLTAVKKRASLKLTKMPLLSSGDLVWDEKRAAPAGPFDAMIEAAKWLAPGAAGGTARPGLAPLDRHPAQIAEPVYLEGYRFDRGEGGASSDPKIRIDADGGASLAVATERMTDTHDLSLDDVAKSQKMIGLLRFDRGRWAVQPLAAQIAGKKSEILSAGYTGASLAAGGDAGGRGSSLGILRERAGKLLRAK